MVRPATLGAALLGAATLSQAPEYVQQYRQRLGGEVDALAAVLAQFDADAGRAGLTRAAAMDDFAARGGFPADRARSMAQVAARHDRLAADRAALAAATPLGRLAVPHRWSDPRLAAGTLRDYVPALPLSSAGAVAAGAGALGGWALARGLGALFRRLFARGGLSAG